MQTEKQTIKITPRQLQVLGQIADFQASRCYSATFAELAEELDVSRPTVFEHIAALRKKGLLAASKGSARSLKLTRSASRLLEAHQQCETYQPARANGLRLAGRVAAGVPVEAIENAELLSLTSVFGDGDDVFALEVAGDSMIDEGISTGDYVICRRQSYAQNGQMVVAVVDAQDATLKRFYKEDARVRLEASNEAFAPIYSDNCQIKAVVLGVLRRL